MYKAEIAAGILPRNRQYRIEFGGLSTYDRIFGAN